MNLVFAQNPPRSRLVGCGEDYLLRSLVEASRTAHWVAAGLDGSELAGRLEQVALDIDQAMRHLGEPVSRAATAAGTPTAPAAVHHFASLTYRERQVLDLIVDGLTNRQIGLALGLAEKTIKNYASTLFVKLDVTRRTQAAVLGARHQRAGVQRVPSPRRPVTPWSLRSAVA